MQQVGSMPILSAGGVLTTKYTMQTGDTRTVTDPTICTRTLQSIWGGQFKSIPNVTKTWDGTGFPMENKEDGGRQTHQQISPRLNSTGSI